MQSKRCDAVSRLGSTETLVPPWIIDFPQDSSTSASMRDTACLVCSMLLLPSQAFGVQGEVKGSHPDDTTIKNAPIGDEYFVKVMYET